MAWSVSAEGKADEMYSKLKKEFDSQHVPRVEGTTEVNVMRGNRVTTDVRPKERADVDDTTSLEFRLALKSIQTYLSTFGSKKVSVELSGGPAGVTTKVKAL